MNDENKVSSVSETVVKERVRRGDLIADRIKRLTPNENAESDETESVDELTTEKNVDSNTDEVTEETDKSEDVLSQIDISALTDEQKADLSEMLQLGAGKALKEERAKRREAEDRLKQYEGSLDEAISKVAPEIVAFSDVATVTDADNQIQENEGQYYAFQQMIDEGWDLNDDGEKGFEIQGQWYSKQQILAHRNGLMDKVKGLKSRKRYLMSANDVESRLTEAEQSIPWLSDSSTKEYKDWKKLIDNSGDVALLERISPQLAENYKAFSAYYVNKGAKKNLTNIKLPLNKKESSSPGNSASPGNRSQGDKTSEQLWGQYKNAQSPSQKRNILTKIRARDIELRQKN